MKNKFIWKKKNQKHYFNIIVKNYIHKLLNFIKNKNYVFYLDHDKEYSLNYDKVVNHYKNNIQVNISDYEKKKKFMHYSKFPILKGTQIHNVPETETGFSVDWVEKNLCFENNGGCGQCGFSYCGGLSFSGHVHNQNISDVCPYDGHIKLYNFFRCDCDNQSSEIECTKENDNLPWALIKCQEPYQDNVQNMSFINNAILLNLKFMKYDVGIPCPKCVKDSRKLIGHFGRHKTKF